MTLAQALIGEVDSKGEREISRMVRSQLCPCEHTRSGNWRRSFTIPRSAEHLLGHFPAGAGRRSRSFASQNIPWDGGLSIRLRRNKRLCRFDRSVTSRTEYRWSRSRLGVSSSLHTRGSGSCRFVLLRAVEQKSKDPLISPQLIGDAIIWRASLTVLLFAAVLFGLIVQLPVFFNLRFGPVRRSLDYCLFLLLWLKWWLKLGRADSMIWRSAAESSAIHVHSSLSPT